MDNKTEFRDFEHGAWQNVADKYERAWSALTKIFIAPLLAAVKIKRGMPLLDLACGPGYVSESAKGLGAFPIGIDFSGNMIKLAREKNPLLEFYEGNAEDLSFEQGSFDAVTMNFGILHVANPEKVFFEAARVLNKGGRFGFTVWAKPEISPGSKIIDDAINKYAALDLNLPEGPPSDKYCNQAQCLKNFKLAGFNPDSMSFVTIEVEWIIPTPSFFFEAELNAGVRTAAILKNQPNEILKKIRSHIENEVEKLKNESGYMIPMSGHVVSAAV